MEADPQPINGALWGQWIRAGSERWDVVQRSWSVFARNTGELVTLVKVPATDVRFSLLLMSDDTEATAPFWQEFDQRLHNELAGAVSLVDHTRRLLNHYRSDAADFVEEYEERNATVTVMNEAAFLRDLRNYLLHYGAAPVLQTMSLNASPQGATGHSIKLSGPSLLKWDGWKSQARSYLEGFPDRDGPVLGQDVVTYANGMAELFAWTFAQRRVLNSPENVPDRFRMEHGTTQ